MKRIFLICLLGLFLQGCGLYPSPESSQTKYNQPEAAKYALSGSIVISKPIPTKVSNSIQDDTVHSPLLGFTPPSKDFVPAENEAWLEIARKTKEIKLRQGSKVVQSVKAEGNITLKPGQYSLQHKQKRPLWYAPDEYFTKRGIDVPASGDRARYRRGALGQYVIYATTTFPIHSGPVWSEDVGGIRVNLAELSSIYYKLPVGASIVVK